jgi:hypothetical protein
LESANVCKSSIRNCYSDWLFGKAMCTQLKNASFIFLRSISFICFRALLMVKSDLRPFQPTTLMEAHHMKKKSLSAAWSTLTWILSRCSSSSTIHGECHSMAIFLMSLWVTDPGRFMFSREESSAVLSFEVAKNARSPVVLVASDSISWQMERVPVGKTFAKLWFTVIIVPSVI